MEGDKEDDKFEQAGVEREHRRGGSGGAEWGFNGVLFCGVSEDAWAFQAECVSLHLVSWFRCLVVFLVLLTFRFRLVVKAESNLAVVSQNNSYSMLQIAVVTHTDISSSQQQHVHCYLALWQHVVLKYTVHVQLTM